MHEAVFVDPVSRFLTLSRRAPDAPVVTWINDQGQEAETLTFSTLARDAGSIAGVLRGRSGLASGDRVLIVMQPGLDFVRAFCGCLLGRLIPIPAYPFAKPEELGRIARNADTRAVLTDAMLLRAMSSVGGDCYDAAVLAARQEAAPLWEPPAPSDLAFLQYTSGSTSEPKGVRITHGNLIHQLECNRQELGLSADARALLWVPQFHDLGLISGLISALIGNGRLYQMSPLTFVRRPALWLEVASRLQATHTAAPNFAYGLVLKKTTPDEVGRLSLQSLRVIMSAAEPINPRLMHAFFATFARAGLRPDVFCGAYGLAEHTVGISVGGRTALWLDEEAFGRRAVSLIDPAKGVGISSCGRPCRDVNVRIVDPETLVSLDDDNVGEIWVDSPSKADGYYNNPELTAAAFHARTADPSDCREYLRTGDLGFLHTGELFVSGRLKDLMIFRGRNVYPTDVEQTVEAAHASVQPRGSVAFAVPADDGEDALVVVAEVAEDTPAAETDLILAAIGKAVMQRHGQPCASVLLVKPGTIPRTASGKLRRRDTRQRFLDGALKLPAVLVRMFPGQVQPALARPGVETLDDSLRRLMVRFVNVLPRKQPQDATPGERQQVAYPSVTARGTMRVLDSAANPPHRFFSPGLVYPVLLRHTNTNREPDDAAVTGRGAAIRVLDPTIPNNLDDTLLDLVLMTGRCGLVRDAAAYVRWFIGDRAAREEMARAHPSIKQYFSDFWRNPVSFAEMHYHSQGTNHYIATDGTRYFVRYRLIEATQGLDRGHHPPTDDAYLAGHIERKSDDDRPTDYLRQEFSKRIAAVPVRYILAIQLRPQPLPENERDELLDATVEWETSWIDVAELTLDAVVAADVANPLSLSPGNAPRDLAVVLARSAHDPASINHLRSLVYDLSGQLRRQEPLRTEYQTMVWKTTETNEPRPRRVCVLGAGPSGLTAARELEKLGVEVTVFERAAEVGGMACSINIDGLPYDLGAHLCTGSYETVASLARDLGVETEATTPYYLYDLEQRSVVPQDHSFFGRQTYERYQETRRSFADIDRPGLSHSASVLGAPVQQWLNQNQLSPLAVSMGPNYTAAGYGYLDDPELSALYLVKFSEMIGALSARQRLSDSWTFTIRGGFQRLWERVAAQLREIHRGTAVDSVERTDREVIVKAGNRRWSFDDVVIAISPADALAILDVDSDERDLLASTQTFDYVTTVIRAEGLPQLGLYLLKQNCAASSRIGHTVAYHHRHAASDIYLFYAYGNGKSEDDLDRALAEDIASMGGTLKQTILRRRFKYMPHPNAATIQAGFFTGLEARQGKRRTYYTGSVLGFELVECVTSHAHAMVQKQFGQESGLTAAAVESWLAREIAAELDLDAPIPRDAQLSSYQIDSVTAAAILGSLSQWIGWSVPPYMLFDQPTIASIAALVMSSRPADSTKALAASPHSSLLIALNAPDPPPPIFMIGGLMGAALYLRELAESFPPHQAVFALQAAGLDGKQPPFETVAGAADAYLSAIRTARPRGPYRLAGHSFGGLVAYEMAGRLRDRGESVQLVLLDTLLFEHGEPEELPTDEMALAELLAAIRLHQQPEVMPNVETLAQMRPNAMHDEVVAAIAGSRPFAGDVSLNRWVKVYRAHSKAMRDFRPKVVPDLPYLLFKAERGYPRVLMHPARKRYACYDKPLLGWDAIAPLPQVTTVPGNHYTIVFGRNASTTANAMMQYFEKAPSLTRAARP